jgi:lipopolysaccharide transport system ATP-binding protein
MAAVNGLCDRAVLLKNGQIAKRGDTIYVVDFYLREALEMADDSMSLRDRKDRTGSGKIRISGFHIEDEKGAPVSCVCSGAPCTFVLSYECQESEVYQNVTVAFGVKTSRDQMLFRNFTGDTGQSFSKVYGTGQFRCFIPSLPLAAGTYRLGFRIVINGEESDYLGGNAASFQVEKGDFFDSGKQTDHAPVLVRHSWSYSRREDESV